MEREKETPSLRHAEGGMSRIITHAAELPIPPFLVEPFERVCELFGPFTVMSFRDRNEPIFSIQPIRHVVVIVVEGSGYPDGAAHGPGAARSSVADSVKAMIEWLAQMPHGASVCVPIDDKDLGVWGPLNADKLSRLRKVGEVP